MYAECMLGLLSLNIGAIQVPDHGGKTQKGATLPDHHGHVVPVSFRLIT